MEKAKKNDIKLAFRQSRDFIGMSEWKDSLNGSGVYAFLAGYAPDITVSEAFQIVGELRDDFYEELY